MKAEDLLGLAVEKQAGDIFLIPGMPFSYKIGGRIICQGESKIFPDEMDRMIIELYLAANNRDMEKVRTHGDDDFSFALYDISMDTSLIKLYRKGIISRENAIIYSNNSELMAKKLDRL